MFNKFKKTKAAISIFLILIFVPMMTMGSIFVDSSRFAMAKSVATSAADLTLNTLLTNYDKQLNDYFGLIASCQDMEQFKTETKEFFVRCITSSGVEASDAEFVAGQIMNVIDGEGSYSDLLQLALVSEGDSLVSEVADGDLSNASLIKTQIVEFMKYRAPINAVTSFLENLLKASKTVEDADEIAEMTEKKTEFYEEETDLMKLLLDLRNLLIQYDAFNTHESLTETIENTKKKLGEGEGSYKSRYEVIHKKIVFDLYNTNGIAATGLETINSSATGNIKKSTRKVLKMVEEKRKEKDPETGETITITEMVEKEVEEEYIDLEKAVRNFFSEMTNYKIAETNFVNSAKTKNFISDTENLTQTYTQSTQNNIYATQYLAKVLVPLNNTGHPESFRVAANKLKNAKADLDATYNAVKNMSDATEKSLILNEQKKLTYHNGAVTASMKTHADNVTDYYNFCPSYFKLYDDFANRINGVSAAATNAEKDSLSIAEGTAVGCIARTKTNNEIVAIYDDITAARTRFSNAKSKAEAIIAKVEQIEKAYDDYNTAFSNWKTAANNSELDGYRDPREIVNVDRNEINNKEQGSYTENDATTAVLAKIKQEDINALKTRFNNIALLMGDAIDAVDDCKYNGTPLVEIHSIESAIYAAAVNESSFERSALNAVAFNFTTPSLLPVVDPTNSPVIYDGQLKLRDDIYEYFREYIEEDDDDVDTSNGEDAKDAIEKMGEDESDSVDDSGQLGKDGKELNNSESRPSAEGSTISSQNRARAEGEKNIDKASSFASDLFKNFSGTLSQLMVNLRDDLLISDYIMSMFSYDTFESEGKLDYALDEQSYSVSTVSAWKTKMGTLADTWNNEDKTFKYNKTLRNNMINDANCYSYGNEVEYVLYGGSNVANKASAYSSIYLLRFVFDLPAVFMEFWSNETVLAIATAIQTASLGIIPIPLTKLVICLALCAIEAGLDMNAIRSGLGVPLVKGKDNLFCSLPGVDDLAEDTTELTYSEDSDAQTDKIGAGGFYFRYGDYLRFFLIFGLMSSEKEKSICLRTADVIQANMRKISGSESKFLLSKSQVYYKIDAKVKVEPLMLRLPINANSIGDILEDTDEWNTMGVSMVRGY